MISLKSGNRVSVLAVIGRRKSMRSKDHSLIFISVIVLFGLVAYWNALENKFVYDDEDIITNNEWLQTSRDLTVLFDSRYFSLTGEYTYRPVVTATVLLDYSVWRLNPFGHHLTNLLLHLATVVIMFLFLRELSRSPIVAFVATLLMGIHPVMSEAVNAIAFREDILVTLLTICSLWMLIGAVTPGKCQPSGVRMIASFGFTLCACFSKENGMVTPFLLTAVLMNRSQIRSAGDIVRRVKQTWKVILPAVFAVIIYLPVRFVILNNPDAPVYDLIGNSRWTALLSSCSIMGHYIRLFIFPDLLRADYEIPVPASIFDGSVLLGAVGMVGLLGLMVHGYRAGRWYGSGFAWYLLALLPVSNLIPIANPIAERYLYLPGVGMFLAIGAFFSIWYERKNTHALESLVSIPSAVILIITVILSARTMQRNPVWRDSLSLWSTTVRDAPRAHRAQMNLGSTLHKAGETEKALPYLLNAVRLKPDYTQAYYDLGVVYENLGNVELAEKNYKKALSLNPHFEEAYSNLGSLYNSLQRYWEAIENYRKALELRPDKAHNYYNLSVALNNMGQLAEAEQMCLKSLELQPDFAFAVNHMGAIAFAKGDLDRAIGYLNKALEQDPSLYHASQTLGLIYWQKEEYDRSIDYYLKTIRLAPQFAPARINLGITYLEVGKYKEAKSSLDSGRKLDPNTAFYADLGSEIADFKANLAQNPSQTTLLKSIGLAYIRLGNVRQGERFLVQYASVHGSDPEVVEKLAECRRMLSEPSPGDTTP